MYGWVDRWDVKKKEFGKRLQLEYKISFTILSWKIVNWWSSVCFVVVASRSNKGICSKFLREVLKKILLNLTRIISFIPKFILYGITIGVGAYVEGRY